MLYGFSLLELNPIQAKSGKEGRKIPAVMFYFLWFLLLCLLFCSCVSIPALLVIFFLIFLKEQFGITIDW